MAREGQPITLITPGTLALFNITSSMKNLIKSLMPGEYNVTPYSGYLTNQCDLRTPPMTFCAQTF